MPELWTGLGGHGRLSMIEVVRVTVSPEPEMISVVNAGLNALCRQISFTDNQCRRLQLATEEIFVYSLHTISRAGLKSPVTVRFRTQIKAFQIILEYVGPRGALDMYLKPGQLQSMRVSNFQGLGLCLAANTIDSLCSTYWSLEGVNSYALSLNVPESGDG